MRDDAENIRHLEACGNCSRCDVLVDAYTTCETCGSWGRTDAPGWGEREGLPICLNCSNKILGLR